MDTENVFITGANRGIGLEMCKQLVEGEKPPKNLFAACRAPETAEELKKLKSNSVKTNVHIIKLDVTNDDEIKSAAEQVTEIVGSNGISLLVNNAAILGNTPFPGTSSQVYMDHFKTNSIAPIIISEAFLPLLKLAADKQNIPLSCKRSAIINITGLIAHFTHVGFVVPGRPMEAYRVSKVALNLATCIMARNLKESGILVVAVHPGWVATDMGGPEADLKTDDSVSKVLKTLSKLSETDHGTVVDFSGVKQDW